MSKKRFLYGLADDKYVKPKPESVRKPRKFDNYKYITAPILKGLPFYDRNDVSIVFKTSPDTLYNLASSVVDAIPLPSVFNWTIDDICRWLRGYGFPQYQNTFRQNLLNGKKLLLVDANALVAMNIKDFDHIRFLTYGIRSLYYYEMTKFGRSITLPTEYHYELYKRFRSHTGAIYDTTRRSDLYRQMQLIRDIPKNLSHWDILERNINSEIDSKYSELFGSFPYRKQYEDKIQPKKLSHTTCAMAICNCVPPCECDWNSNQIRRNVKLSNNKIPYIHVSTGQTVIGVLQKLFPRRYNIKKIYYSSKV